MLDKKDVHSDCSTFRYCVCMHVYVVALMGPSSHTHSLMFVLLYACFSTGLNVMIKTSCLSWIKATSLFCYVLFCAIEREVYGSRHSVDQL